MARIAGIDVTAAVWNATRGQFQRGTLTKITMMPRTEGALTEDRTRETPHPYEGVLTQRALRGRDGTLTGVVESSILILAGSLPAGVAPAQGDRISITLQGRTGTTSGTIASVSSDPGGGTYTCMLAGG